MASFQAKRLRLLSTVLLMFLIGAFFPANALAQTKSIDKGITLSPIKYVLTAKPGETISVKLKVYNATLSDKTVYFYIRNFKSDNKSGVPLFTEEARPFTASLKDWIKLSQNPINTKRITDDNTNVTLLDIVIKIPEDAEPGGHYAGVIATLKNPADQVSTDGPALSFNANQGAIILLNVEEDTSKNLLIEDFYAKDPFLTSKNKVDFFEWMPIDFLSIVKNTGNTHVIPKGNIIIYNGTKKVGTLKFNTENGNILRESSREFENNWAGGMFELRAEKDEDGKIILNEDGSTKTRLNVDLSKIAEFRFGQYTAKLALVYDDNGELKSEVKDYSFWIIPWKLILLLIILIIVILTAWRLRTRLNRKNASSSQNDKDNKSY
jgi:hypothetical protein